MDSYNPKDTFSSLYDQNAFKPGFLGPMDAISEANYRHLSLMYQRGYYPIRRRKPEKQAAAEKVSKDTATKTTPNKIELMEW